uniref:Uncharacterized protein n=1 Tax=Arundo donax TaxID=35708 RepID=A0A0A9CY87_ARUDO
MKGIETRGDLITPKERRRGRRSPLAAGSLRRNSEMRPGVGFEFRARRGRDGRGRRG